MSKKPKIPTKFFKKARWITNLFLALSFVIILAVIIAISIHFLFIDKIYPGIAIAGVDVGLLTKNEAQNKLSDILSNRLSNKLIFAYYPSTQSAIPGGQKIEINLSDNPMPDLNPSISQAFTFGHWQAFYLPTNIEINPGLTFDDDLSQTSDQIDLPSIDSELAVSDNEITVTPSQPGTVVNKEVLKKYLTTYINTGKLPSQILPLQKAEPKLSYQSALKIKNRLDQLKLNPIKLTYQDQTFNLELKDVLPLIDLQNSQKQLALNKDKTNQYIELIAQKIDRPVQEPLFNFDPSSPNKIKQFQPPTEGLTLDRQKTFDQIAEVLASNQNEATLSVQTVEPKNKLANDFGINQLIGHGASNFGGSIDNRIFNVKLAASRVNGVLVPPGETFSFDNTIGDVTAATGYKQAYVIKSGRTVLDDGGGVCQVSTTLFRAVLNSGLPVESRTAHAYRVHYYENGGYPPGIDATTFYPTVDFKFKNETAHYILIQAYSEGLNLYVDLYGTSDGRVATITKPVITSSTPPPPEIRQDDPTLPKGTVKQVDFAAWGANVYFKRTVVKDGQTIINETFKSNYRPWQAIFLVGTKEG